MTGTIVRSESGIEGGPTKGRLAAFAVALAGSAVLGLVAGLIWAAVAPRALLQEVARGEAQVVNTESHAYISADAWFCVIVAVGGLITGVLGYRFLIRRAGWPAAAGLVLGALAASLITLWVGENMGLGTYNHQLATSAVGAFFNSSLALGAKSGLVFWPLITSLAILLAETGGRGSGKPLAGIVRPGDPDWPGGHAP
jgi:hypothetical protein